LEDDKIIDLYLERSEIAIYETSMKYGNYCRTIAFNILSNSEDVEECENDTYIAAWNTIPPTRPQKLSSFLGRLTRNIALDRFDYNTAKKRNGKFDKILSELDEVLGTTSYSPEMQYESQEISRLINEFLLNIDSKTRKLFVRRYWYCDSIAIIAIRFNFSESRVKSTLFRTRHKLKEFLSKEGVSYE